MKGREYLNWLTEEEQSKWETNFICLNKTENDIHDFLDFNHSSWVGFIGSSFEFRKTPEGVNYWSNIYSKYRKYDNLNVKPGFNIFNKQPRIL